MVYIASYESCEPKKFSRSSNKVERNYFQEQQPNQIHGYNQNMGLVNKMGQSVASYKWRYPDGEIVVVPICVNGRCCSSRCEGIVSH